MKKITISKFLSTQFDLKYSNVNNIEVEDSPMAVGGFGEVYICTKINGNNPPNDQVIKIFIDNGTGSADHSFKTIQALQNKILQKAQSLSNIGLSFFKEYPALIAVPQFSFEGNINGITVKGFSSNNLSKSGFIEFDKILEDENALNRYQDASFDAKLLIATHFVKAIMLLKEFQFIHADLKPESIFINLTENKCAIIDFDSGVVTEKPTDEPNTWGAPGDWVAPEIWKQLSEQSVSNRKIKVDLYTDIWSVAIGVHYLLTTCHPLFFLNEVSQNSVSKYLKSYSWPDIDAKHADFKSEYTSQYNQYIKWVQNTLPKEIKDRFYQTITYGYLHRIKRPSYEQWLSALSISQKPPVIKYFKADSDVLINGAPVTISWNVAGAHTIFISGGIGNVSRQDSIQVLPNKTTIYKISAIGHFGQVESEIKLFVFPTPVIETISVPAPSFRMSININPEYFENTTKNLSEQLKKVNESKLKTLSYSLQNNLNDTLRPIQNSNSISSVFEAILKILKRK